MKDKILSGILNLKLKLCLKEYLKGVHYFRLLEYPIVYDNLNLKTGFRVLDAGSNYINFFSLFLASERKFQVHAIDSRKITKNIRKHLDKTIAKLNLKDNISIKSMDMRKLSYPNNYFDRVYSISSIEHIEGIG
ncbi:MAG: class I SAM-dependent methyltransferase [Nanoarchaeota archaeon]